MSSPEDRQTDGIARFSETYTPERKAEFLLNNAVDEADYALAREKVRRMGLDPDDIPHARLPDV